MDLAVNRPKLLNSSVLLVVEIHYAGTNPPDRQLKLPETTAFSHSSKTMTMYALSHTAN